MEHGTEYAEGTNTSFRVLGPIDVVRHGEALDLGPYKQRSLLALLLMNADRVVTTERILEELWGTESANKEKALWVYISHLRSVLEPERERRAVGTVIERLDHGYRLNIGDAVLDSRAFENHLKRAQDSSDDAALRAEEIADGLELWRGSAYEDFQYESFAIAEADRLNDLRAGAFEDRVDAVLELHSGSELVSQIENHLRRHPLRERSVSQLMIVLYRTGRAAEALRTYSRFRRYLGEELGIEPTPELSALEERILLHDPSLSSSGSAVALDISGAANPYKGLAAFQADDADTFFGRNRLVAEVIRTMNGNDALTALVGASGSGKSSLVMAGVIPALGNDAIAGSPSWSVVLMVPGTKPFTEIEAALNRVADRPASDLMRVLHSGRDGIMRAALRALPDGTDRLVLVIDQLEELFTLTAPAERSEFLDGLCELLDDPHRRVSVIVMLRADFYDRALEHPEFARMLGRGVVNVPPLSLEELEEAIEGPARHVAVDVDSSLLSQLVVDVVGKPGALPLLQHALTELFERRDGRRMTLNSYEAMGRVGGTIAARAEDIYQELLPAEQEATRQIFLRLVTVSAGDEWTRRRVPGSELLALKVPAVTIQAVIDAFSRHRLITFDMDRVSHAAVVEVVHEALLTEWPRLTEWIVDAAEDIVVQMRLGAATDEWIEAGEAGDYLFAGTRLAEYNAWSYSTTLLLTDDQRSFLEESVRTAEALKAADRRRLSVQGKLRRRARQRSMALVFALLVIAGIAGTAVVSAIENVPVVAVVYADNETQAGREIAAGIDAVRNELGVDVISIRPPFVSFETEVTEAISDRAELIIVDGQFEGPAFRSAVRFPDQRWVVLRRTTSGSGFAVHEGGFLMGVAAAGESGTTKVGFVGLHQNSETERLRAGFEAGVREHRPSVEVLATYASANPWLDGDADALVESAASELYAAGVDIIFNAAQSPGVVAAARRYRAETGDHVYVIGAFTDEYLEVGPDDRDFILTSLVKQYDEIVVAIVADWQNDGELEDPHEWTLGEGAMSYSSSGNEFAERVMRDVDTLRQRVISGDVSVPTASDASLLPPPKSTRVLDASVTFDGSVCSYEGPDEVPLGTLLNLTLVNHTSADAMLEVGDERLIMVTAPAGAAGHGYAAMRDDHAALVCVSTDDGLRITAGRSPKHAPSTDEVDVVVTISEGDCDVQVLSTVSDGDLVGFLIENDATNNGGAYSWTLGDTGLPAIDDTDFRPAFSDFTLRWRWEEVKPGRSAFHSRVLSAGDWGVGCWSAGSAGEEQVPINVYQVGGVVEVDAR